MHWDIVKHLTLAVFAVDLFCFYIVKIVISEPMLTETERTRPYRFAFESFGIDIKDIEMISPGIGDFFLICLKLGL